MLKKLITAAMAGAFATALAAPAVMACPGEEGKVAKKEAKDTAKTAEKAKAKPKKTVKPEKDKVKISSKRVINKG